LWSKILPTALGKLEHFVQTEASAMPIYIVRVDFNIERIERTDHYIYLQRRLMPLRLRAALWVVTKVGRLKSAQL